LEQCIAHSQQPTAVALPNEVAKLLKPQIDADRRRSLIRRSAWLAGTAAIALVALTIALNLPNHPEPALPLPSPLAGEGPGVRGKNGQETSLAETAWHDDIAPQLIEAQAAVEQLEAAASQISDFKSQVSDFDPEISNLKSEISNLDSDVADDWTNRLQPTTPHQEPKR
jgi:hypothetical protein